MNEYSSIISILVVLFLISIFIASLTTNFESKKEISPTDNTSEPPIQLYRDSDKNIIKYKPFPFGWWLTASCLGWLFSWVQMAGRLHLNGQNNSINISVIFGIAVGALFFSGLPMFIAWRRHLKRRKIVYALAGLGGCLPGGILLLIIALMWSCIGRRAK